MAKIAISLPDEVLESIERERKDTGETRSQFLRRAVEEYFHRKGERAAIQEYIQGYLRHPETEDELGWVEAASQAVLAEYPWHDEEEQ